MLTQEKEIDCPDWMQPVEEPKPWPCTFTSFSRTSGGRLSLGVQFECSQVPRDQVRLCMCKRSASLVLKTRLHEEESFDQQEFLDGDALQLMADCGPLSDNSKRLGIRLSFAESAPYERLYELSGSSGFVMVKAYGEQPKADKPKRKTDPAQMAIPFVPEWRKSEIDALRELGISQKVCDTLAAADVNTLGDLQDRMKKHGQFWWKDIKGIGDGKASNITDAFNEFVTRSEQGQDTEPEDFDEEYSDDE